MSRIRLSIVAIAFSGCYLSHGLDDAGDAGPDVPSDVPSVDTLDAPDSPTARCFVGDTDVEVDLRAEIVQSCAAWHSLDELAGTATIQRSDTEFSIDFGGDVVFSGTVVDDTVALAYVHEHEFGDGCLWRASEALGGTLNSGCTISLSYEYTEEVADTRGRNCASPCAAMANVRLDLR